MGHRLLKRDGVVVIVHLACRDDWRATTDLDDAQLQDETERQTLREEASELNAQRQSLIDQAAQATSLRPLSV